MKKGETYTQGFESRDKLKDFMDKYKIQDSDIKEVVMHWIAPETVEE